VNSGESVTYRDPPPLAISFPGFSAQLKADVLTCTLTEHYASVESARAVVEEYLRGWEIHTALTRGHGEISFTFRSARVVDQDPVRGSGQVSTAETSDRVVAGDTFSAHVIRRTYPAPEPAFRATPDVLTLWQRYEGYLAGREPLQAMAFFCLTVIEGRAPAGKGTSRARAARALGIEESVLRHLGELTSMRGDARTARKASGATAPLTPREATWIEAAVRALVRRVGDRDAGRAVPLLTMNDLPPL